jgi:hypothetical protein
MGHEISSGETRGLKGEDAIEEVRNRRGEFLCILSTA